MASLAEIQQLLTEIRNELPALVQRSQITPVQIVVAEGLSDISERLGLVQAGEFRAGNSIEPGMGFTGVRMAYPGMNYLSQEWNFVGINADVLQFGLNAADGKAYFAGGAAKIDSTGIVLVGGEHPSASYINWYSDDTAALIGQVVAFYVGTDSGIQVVGQAKSASYAGVSHLIAKDSSGNFQAGVEVRGGGEVQVDLRNAALDGASQQRVRIMSNTSATNVTSIMLGLELNTKGAAANNFGAGISFNIENSSGSALEVGRLVCTFTDVTAGSEDTKISAFYMLNGVLTEKVLAP